MVGSGMLKAGEWDNEGWRELSAEGVVPIPAILQQIDPNHVEKVLTHVIQVLLATAAVDHLVPSLPACL